MKASLPNLELLEYQAKLIAKKNKKLMERLTENCSLQGLKSVRIDLDAEMFTQMWGNTCTGFDVCANGEPAMGGCAITKAYTCVFCEPITSTYFVFFDGKFCYQVEKPSAKFLKDLKNKNLEPLSKAREVY